MFVKFNLNLSVLESLEAHQGLLKVSETPSWDTVAYISLLHTLCRHRLKLCVEPVFKIQENVHSVSAKAQTNMWQITDCDLNKWKGTQFIHFISDDYKYVQLAV